MPALVRFIGYSVVLQLLALSLFRGVFWWVFRDSLNPVPADVLAKAFYLGLKFDLRLCLLVHLPLALLGWMPALHPVLGSPGRRLWRGALVASGLALIFVYGIDLGHYGYLASRLDASSLRFLANPYESFGVLWESYPVISGPLVALGLAALYFWTLTRKVDRLAGRSATPLRGRQLGLAIAGTVLLFAGGIYGKLSYYPLRWSDAFFSTHEFASSVALNPALYFFETFKNRNVEQDPEAVRRYYPELAAQLGVDKPDPKSLDFDRKLASRKESKRPNVVIVLLESLAYYKTGLSGNPLDPSPHLDAIAKEGVLFRRFYAPHGGTARAVFSSFTGLPDVEPTKTSTRNPLIVNQHTLFNAFQGYEKFYFLGGSASWANIRALLKTNIPGLRIYEEGSYSSPRVDVWGISDLHLFEEANQILTETEEPFAAFIHTAGNHKPFTIPDDSRGFTRSGANQEEVAANGFDTIAEYEGFRLMDHSVGFFMEEARKQPYFENTIFAFFGDHGSPAATQHRPPGENQLRLTRYHSPLIFYAPGRLDAAVVDDIGSTIDVLPTLAQLAGVGGINTTLGRPLLDPGFEEDRVAFTITGQGRGPLLGLVNRDFYFLVNYDGSNPRLHRIYAEDPRTNLAEELTDIAESMQRKTLAIYETTKYMRYHNRPKHQH